MLKVFVAESNAYALLARAARAVWGWETLPEISRLSGGKPVFTDAPGHHFSLSHSGRLALCALSDAPVGADIEVIRPRKENLPAYALKGERYERYLSLGGDWPAFYALWTEVESIVKYTGEGLQAWQRAQVPEGCVISHLNGPGWAASVCGHEVTQGPGCDQRLTDLPFPFPARRATISGGDQNER